MTNTYIFVSLADQMIMCQLILITVSQQHVIANEECTAQTRFLLYFQFHKLTVCPAVKTDFK